MGKICNSPIHSRDVIDPLVWAELLELLEDDDPDILGEMIDSYLEDASTALALIQEASERGDAVALRRAVHALRSPSASLGASDLARSCGEIEKSLRDAAEYDPWTTAGIDALHAETKRAMAALLCRHPHHGR